MEYGVGIVGTGAVADIHARAIRGSRGLRLNAVLSRTEPRATEFGARWGCRPYSDPAKFFEDPGVHVVSVCTPPGCHVEPALQAIAAGRHVMVEKPLEATRAGCDAIVEAAAAAGMRAGGIFQSRFQDAPALLKAAIDRGRFGRIVIGDARVKWYRAQSYYDGWKAKKLFGGGVLMNQAIHAVDLLQWYLGPVEEVHASAACLGHTGVDIEDTVVAVLTFTSGSRGVIQASTACYPGFLKTLEITGTAGSATLEEEDITKWEFAAPLPEDQAIRSRYAHTTGSGGGAADPMAIGVHGHQRQYEDFVAAIRDGRAPMVEAGEARKAVDIILALYRSAESDRPVRLQG